MVMKSKETSDKAGSFAKGGTTHMFGKTHAGPQVPGYADPAGGRNNAQKNISGGSTHMFGHMTADTQVPGQTAHETSGGGKFIQGGKGPNNHMFGYTGSCPAKPA